MRIGNGETASAAPGRRPTWFSRWNDCLKGTEKRDKRNTYKFTHTHTLVDSELPRNNRSWHLLPVDHGFAILSVDSTVPFLPPTLYTSHSVSREHGSKSPKAAQRVISSSLSHHPPKPPKPLTLAYRSRYFGRHVIHNRRPNRLPYVRHSPPLLCDPGRDRYLQLFRLSNSPSRRCAPRPACDPTVFFILCSIDYPAFRLLASRRMVSIYYSLSRCQCVYV